MKMKIKGKIYVYVPQSGAQLSYGSSVQQIGDHHASSTLITSLEDL